MGRLAASEKNVESAQLFIAGGLLLAISILTVATVLNSVGHSQDVALESADSDHIDALQKIDGIERSLEIGMSGVGGNPSEASNGYDDYNVSYQSVVNSNGLARGESVEISEPGSRTEAWNPGQNEVMSFENATGDGTWTMVESITDVYSMRFNISMASVPGNTYRMNVSTSSVSFPVGVSVPGGWYATMSQTASGDLRVNAIGYGTEAPTTETKTIEPEGGYAEFDLFEIVDGTFSSDPNAVRFEDADSINGKYDFRFDDSSTISGPCAAPCTDREKSKYAVGILHEVEDVTVRYIDSSINYTESLDVTLGMNGASTNGTPTVSGDPYLKVRTQGNNSPVDVGDNIMVDYEVENIGTQDASSDDVNLFVRTKSGESKDDTDTVSVNSGNTATGTLEWDTTGGEAGTYTVFVRTGDDEESIKVSVNEAGGDAGIDAGIVGMIG